jgi:hypothetical protein
MEFQKQTQHDYARLVYEVFSLVGTWLQFATSYRFTGVVAEEKVLTEHPQTISCMHFT